MLLSAVSVLVVAQSSSEIPEGLMNNPVYLCMHETFFIMMCIEQSVQGKEFSSLFIITFVNGRLQHLYATPDWQFLP